MSSPAVPNRLVVLATFDPDGELAPHVRHHIESWQGECSRLIVVTTSRLTEWARDWLRQRCELVERENLGYDFYSYKVGLDTAGDLSADTEVVLCNDTFVGPLLPYAAVFDRLADRAVDFWGITRCDRISPHVQSYFIVFRPWVVGSATFRGFWSDMVPESNRRQVIRRYEIGLSRTLLKAGFTMGSYFEESPVERRRARRRVVWWALHRTDVGRRRTAGVRKRIERAAEPWNPVSGLADSAVHGTRLPVVKVDTVRFDPYGLGAERLLRACTRRYPDAFAGFEHYLARTADRYPPRRGEVLLPIPPLLRPLRWAVGFK